MIRNPLAAWLTVTGVGLALMAFAAVAKSAPVAATAVNAAASGATATIREIRWNDLVPKDWKPPRIPPMLRMLSDSSFEAQDALAQMRALWDVAPTVDDMNGVLVKLPGYVVPLEEVRGGLKEFLLVPYFGACIHTPPPPANQASLGKP